MPTETARALNQFHSKSVNRFRKWTFDAKMQWNNIVANSRSEIQSVIPVQLVYFHNTLHSQSLLHFQSFPASSIASISVNVSRQLYTWPIEQFSIKSSTDANFLSGHFWRSGVHWTGTTCIFVARPGASHNNDNHNTISSCCSNQKTTSSSSSSPYNYDCPNSTCTPTSRNCSGSSSSSATTITNTAANCSESIGNYSGKYLWRNRRRWRHQSIDGRWRGAPLPWRTSTKCSLHIWHIDRWLHQRSFDSSARDTQRFSTQRHVFVQRWIFQTYHSLRSRWKWISRGQVSLKFIVDFSFISVNQLHFDTFSGKKLSQSVKVRNIIQMEEPMSPHNCTAAKANTQSPLTILSVVVTLQHPRGPNTVSVNAFKCKFQFAKMRKINENYLKRFETFILCAASSSFNVVYQHQTDSNAERSCERYINSLWIGQRFRHCEWLTNCIWRFRSVYCAVCAHCTMKLVWQTIVYTVTQCSQHSHTLLTSVWQWPYVCRTVCLCACLYFTKLIQNSDTLRSDRFASICFCFTQNTIHISLFGAFSDPANAFSHFTYVYSHENTCGFHHMFAVKQFNKKKEINSLAESFGAKHSRPKQTFDAAAAVNHNRSHTNFIIFVD